MKITRLLLVLSISLLFLLPAFAAFANDDMGMDARGKPDKPPGKPDPTDPTDPTDPGTGDGVVNKYALIIGISDYEGTSSDLNYADDDARDWNDKLKIWGFSITMLLDQQATANNIISAFQDLAALPDGDDIVAITYSGHGYYDKSIRESGLVSSDLYLVTASTLKNALSGMTAGAVFFFDDACNQGTMNTLVGDNWVAAIGSSKTSYTYDGDASMANGILTYFAIHEAIEQYDYTTAEAISNYAINTFNSATPGRGTVYDNYSGDLNLAI